jgi:hypothetical protein
MQPPSRKPELSFTSCVSARGDNLRLAALAMGLAVAAAEAFPSMALPFLVGGLFAGARWVRAVWRRWDMIDRLAAEPDAHVIPEIFDYASREATMEKRRMLASRIRDIAPAPGHPNEARLAAVSDELESLARELETDTLELDTATAVACARFVHDWGSPLFDERVPPHELGARVRRLRTGFGVARH